MARSPRQTSDITEFVAVDSLDDESNPETSTSQERAASDFLSQMGSLGEGFTVFVHRVPFGNNSTEEFVGKWPADKYDFGSLCELLSTQYGPGDYRVRVFKAGRSGALQNQLVPIAKPITPRDNTPVRLEGSTDLARMLEAMLISQREDRAAMRELLAGRQSPDDAEDRALAKMVKYKELFGAAPVAPQQDAITTLVATLGGLAKLKGIAGELGFMGGAEPAGDDSIMGVVKSLGPQLLGTIQREQEIRAAGMTHKALEQTPAPAQRQPNPQAHQAPQLDPQARQLFQHLQGMAAQDTALEIDNDPVKFLCENAQVAAFLKANLIDHPRPFKALVQYWPDALDYADWWLELIDLVTERLTAQGAAGDTPDDSANSMPKAEDDISSGDNT